MSAWAGYLGPGNVDQLEGLLGDQARTSVGSGYGLGIRLDGPEPGKFETAPGGRITVSVGSDTDAFSSAAVVQFPKVGKQAVRCFSPRYFAAGSLPPGSGSPKAWM